MMMSRGIRGGEIGLLLHEVKRGFAGAGRGGGFLLLALLFFLIQTEDRAHWRAAVAATHLIALDLFLHLARVAGEGHRFQPLLSDLLARHLADAVGAEVNALERLLDLVERVLLLAQQDALYEIQE